MGSDRRQAGECRAGSDYWEKTVVTTGQPDQAAIHQIDNYETYLEPDGPADYEQGNGEELTA